VCRFVRHALGGPTVAEHDKLKKDLVELQVKYDLLLSQHEECCRQVYSASFQISTIFKTENELVCGVLLLGMPFVIAMTESMKIPAHDQVSYTRKCVSVGYN